MTGARWSTAGAMATSLAVFLACDLTIGTEPAPIYICVVDGDTLHLDRPDSTGVRCASIDSLQVGR